MRNWFRLSVAINILFILFFIGKRYYYSHSSAPNIPPGMVADYMNNMGIRKLNLVPVYKGDIVLIGTSITAGMPAGMLTTERVKNFGIGGNQTAQIMNRLDSIEGKPSKIFIEAGINDIRAGVSLDSATYNYRNILRKLKGSEIFVESVLPVFGEFEKLQPSVDSFNQKLMVLCKAEGATFIAMGDGFTKDLTDDGLHPNINGYKYMKGKLDSLIK